MPKRLVKGGDHTFIVSKYGEFSHTIPNRVLSQEAQLAVSIIEKWAMVTSQTGAGLQGALLKPGEVVERAFEIARLTHAHIKAHKLDAPFPFKKVFGDDQNG